MDIEVTEHKVEKLREGDGFVMYNVTGLAKHDGKLSYFAVGLKVGDDQTIMECLLLSLQRLREIWKGRASA